MKEDLFPVTNAHMCSYADWQIIQAPKSSAAYNTVESRSDPYIGRSWGHHFIPLLSSGVHSSSGWMDIGITFIFQKDRWRQQQLLKVTAGAAACGVSQVSYAWTSPLRRDRITPKSWLSLWQCLLLPPTQLMDSASLFSGVFKLLIGCDAWTHLSLPWQNLKAFKKVKLKITLNRNLFYKGNGVDRTHAW